jgi:hypothetical protein
MCFFNYIIGLSIISTIHPIFVKYLKNRVMRKILLNFIILSAGCLSVWGQARKSIIYNGTGTSAENRLAAMALAGIVNRVEPALYLLNVYETWSYSETDEKWRDIYASDGKVNFTTISNIADLLQHFNHHIKGVITYDPSLTYGNFEGQNFRWQGEVATMLSGLADCIPLPYNSSLIPHLRPDSVWIKDYFGGKDSIRISAKLELDSHPWNHSALSQEDRYFTILNWGLDNILPFCNPGKFYLREITDWTVNQRMFQMNLAGTESLRFTSLSDIKAEKIERVMNYLRNSHPGEVFHVYGWMRPEPLVQWVSAYGGSFHETLLANLSWHHSFPVDTNFVYTRPSSIDYGVPEEKHYVMIMGSEGDAGNWNFGFQSGAWHSPYRGEVPFGWGFNLHFFREFPFVAQYYYRTATVNDGFMSVTSPLGYAYADMFPNDYLPDAIDQSALLLQKYNIPSVYAYKHYNGAGVSTYRGVVISNNYNFNKLGSFAKETGAELTFLFDPALATQRLYTQYGGLLYNHVNDGTFYGDFSDLNATAQRILNSLLGKQRPTFLLAGYQRMRRDGTVINANNKADITPERLVMLQQIIKSDPQIGQYVEFVTPEKFTQFIRMNLQSQVFSPAAVSEAIQIRKSGNDVLTVTWTGEAEPRVTVSVYDTSGRLVLRIPYTSLDQPQLNLPLIGIAPGLYILTLQGVKTSLSNKFLR